MANGLRNSNDHPHCTELTVYPHPGRANAGFGFGIEVLGLRP